MSVELHNIFQNQNTNQAHVTFLMTSSYFKTVVEVTYFYKSIKFSLYNYSFYN